MATYNRNEIKILSRAFIHHCQNILNKLVESFKLFPFYWSQFINCVPISFHFYRYRFPHSEDVFSLNIWTLSSTDPAQCQPGLLNKRLKWKKKRKKNQLNFYHPLTSCLCSDPFSGNAILQVAFFCFVLNRLFWRHFNKKNFVRTDVERLEPKSLIYHRTN